MKKGVRTTVGWIDEEVLAFTAGQDAVLDHRLVRDDCLGSAAHATMLAAMPVSTRIFSKTDLQKIRLALMDIMASAESDHFKITTRDQDVHMAVERVLTKKLGALGQKIHTGRSRNDQVALDLRLFGRRELLGLCREMAELAGALIKFGYRGRSVPMVGRTHMQPAMPSSVGLWATAYAECLQEDFEWLQRAYRTNNRCPLGSAAGYGVPLPIDRAMTARLLAFDAPIHNVLFAGNARGRMETSIIAVLAQVMGSLSRLAQDLILFSMPEFGYFSWPAEMGTGSSIMPQKNNPDVLELIRAKSARVLALHQCAADIVRCAPSGYNRDLQEVKGPFLEAMDITRASVRVMSRLVTGIRMNRPTLKRAFSAGVFATDAALERVADGEPFRVAYQWVKDHMDELESRDPVAALQAKTHLGGTAGLDFQGYRDKQKAQQAFVSTEVRRIQRAYTKLMGQQVEI